MDLGHYVAQTEWARREGLIRVKDHGIPSQKSGIWSSPNPPWLKQTRWHLSQNEKLVMSPGSTGRRGPSFSETSSVKYRVQRWSQVIAYPFKPSGPYREDVVQHRGPNNTRDSYLAPCRQFSQSVIFRLSQCHGDEFGFHHLLQIWARSAAIQAAFQRMVCQ